MITAHVAGLPVEEVLPVLLGGSAWLVLNAPGYALRTAASTSSSREKS